MSGKKSFLKAMRYFLLTAIILIQLTAMSQSPYLSILVKMDSVKAESIRYKIEMNICEPKKKTERGDWFIHDTSTIDFALLKTKDIECGGYFDKGMPTQISGKEETTTFNQFQFSGQVFAWEKIFVFKISNYSSRGWHPEMYIVIPMKYKSFVTRIDLTGIEFLSDKVVVLNDLIPVYEGPGSRMVLHQSLKNEKGVDVKTYPLKELLEGK